MRAELISEHTSVQPGRPASLALRLTVDPGWHVYWRNAGDAGIAPSAKWDLPEGFRAGAFRWPIPRRHDEGSITTFVLEGDVILPFEVAVPATLPAEGTVTLAADASWLVCRDVCLDENARVTLALPVSKGVPAEDPARRDAFSAARRSLPAALATGAVTVARDGAAVTIDLAKSGIHLRKDTRIEFFPHDDSVVSYAPARRDDAGTKVVLAARRPDAADAERLRGVLVVVDGTTRAGHEIDAPVARSGAAKKEQQEDRR